ncbi:hypothetical protein E2C01_014036 [Portunus trituberculatus]|uniref:Uncharacterized protein n=1 Tax=Portunus trituberculatus TaxID=210409 RepID=A0A5B7DIY1_PORTR|nr:hypothetical protein [Portunus trituberculatus]
MLPRAGVPRPDSRTSACDGGSRYLAKTWAEFFHPGILRRFFHLYSLSRGCGCAEEALGVSHQPVWWSCEKRLEGADTCLNWTLFISHLMCRRRSVEF